MSELLFPLQFKRQYSGPLDADNVFSTSAAMNAYLSNSLRYAGQIATCLDYPKQVFVMNSAMTAWESVSSSATSASYNIRNLTGASVNALAYGTSAGGLATDVNINISNISELRGFNINSYGDQQISDFFISHEDGTVNNTFNYVYNTASSAGPTMGLGYSADGVSVTDFEIRFTSASVSAEFNAGINIPSSAVYKVGGNQINTKSLSDVSSAVPTNGQTLVYSSAVSKYVPSTISAGTVDHHALSNLSTYDDHPQYLTSGRADARYLTSGTVISQSLVSSASGWITSALSGKESSVAAGTSAQYYRGDKTWQTINTKVLTDVSSAIASNKQILLYNSATSSYNPTDSYSIAGADSGASTGIISFGGLTTTSSTTFNVGAIKALFTDNTTSAGAPVIQYKEFTAQNNIVDTYRTSVNSTFIGIDSSGTIIQKSIPFTPSEARTIIPLGATIHSDRVNITNVNNGPRLVIGPTNQFNDLVDSLKPFNINDNVFSANGANLAINKTAGAIFKVGSNYINDPKDPHTLDLPSLTAPTTIRHHLRDGTEYANTSAIDASHYDNNGVLATVSTNNWSIQRIFLFQTNLVRIQYGQNLYGSRSNALAALNSETFIVDPIMAANGILRAVLIVRGGAAALNSLNDAQFIEAGQFGSMTGIGAYSVTTMQGAYDNSTTPEIVTNASLGAVSYQNGLVDNTNKVLEVNNYSGVTTFSVDGLGNTSATAFIEGGTLLSNKYELKLSSGTSAQYYRGDKTWQTLDKSAVGLGNVDNTSDSNKPVSSAVAAALALKEPVISSGTSAQWYRGDKTWQTLTTNDIPGLDASKITSGTISAARLGSGTASSATYLGGDSAWHLALTKTSGTFNTTLTSGYTDITYSALPAGYPFSLQFFKDNEIVSIACTNITATGFRANWNAMPSPAPTITYVVIG